MNYRSTVSIALLLFVGCSTRTLPIDGGGEGDGTAASTSGNTTSGNTTTGAPVTTTGVPDPVTGGEDETEDTGPVPTTFVPDDDTGGSSCGEECDIWNPDDCPAGEKCTAVACEVGSSAWDSNVCREIQGNAQLDEDCEYTDGSGVSGNDTCALGLMCWNADPDTGLGTCIPFCTGSPDAPMCPSGWECAIAGNGVLSVCLPSCDPLGDDCSNGDLCLPTGDGYDCVLDASGDAAPYATPCNYINVCNAGLMCANAAAVPEPSCEGATGCCSPFCNLQNPEPCPGQGQLCEPVYDPQPPDYEYVGVCAVPQ
jgi:hypothetical protein